MLTGFYTAASGILQQERTISVLTNNMVNAQTPGFRASRVVSTTFQQEFLTRLEGRNSGYIGVGSPIRIVDEVPVNFETGTLEQTERPYDMALDGVGFFLVESAGTPPQQYLTRNGNFDIDEEGYLILRGVGRVQSTGGGDIQLGDSDFVVYEDGRIYGENGTQIATLAVMVVPEDAELELNTNGQYTIENMDSLIQVDDPKVVQGWLERPNMDFNREYTLVIEAQRAFQACSTALQIIDQINQKAATRIAGL